MKTDQQASAAFGQVIYRSEDPKEPKARNSLRWPGIEISRRDMKSGKELFFGPAAALPVADA